MKYKLKLINWHLYLCKERNEYDRCIYTCYLCLFKHTDNCGSLKPSCTERIGIRHYVYKKIF